MTLIQLEHHMEQSEALRLEFEKMWAKQKLVLKRDTYMSERCLAAAMGTAWVAFVQGYNIAKRNR